MKIKNLCKKIFDLELRHFFVESSSNNVIKCLKTKSCESIDDILSIIDKSYLDNEGYYILIREKIGQKGYVIRDHLGKQSLCYFVDQDILYLGDKSSSLLKLSNIPRQFDWSNAFVLNSLIKTSKSTSFFKSIKIIEPGEYLQIDNNEVSSVKYWKPKRGNGTYSHIANLDEDDLSKLYFEIIQENIERVVNNNDRISLCLSGGLDSCIIASLLRDKCELTTWSICSPYFYRNGDSLNALKICKELGLFNNMLSIDYLNPKYDKDDLINHICQTENPYFNSVFFLKSRLYSHLDTISDQFDLLVSGFGSDQFNGGNSSGITSSFSLTQVGSSEEKYLNALSTFADLKGYNKISSNGLGQVSRYLNYEYLGDSTKADYAWSSWIDYTSKFIANQDLEFESKMPNNFEINFPFLDKRLIEFVLNVNEDLIGTPFTEKEILRRGVNEIIPEFLRTKPKNAHLQNFTQESFGLLEILAKDNFEFLFDLFPTDHEVVNRDKLISDLKFMFETNRIADFPQAMTIVNCRILEKYLGQTNLIAPINSKVLFISNENKELRDSERDLNEIYEHNSFAHIEKLEESYVLSWEEEVDLLFSKKSSDLFIIKGEEIIYQICNKESQKLINILKNIDGKTSFDQLGVEPNNNVISKNLLELIHTEVLLLVSP